MKEDNVSETPNFLVIPTYICNVFTKDLISAYNSNHNTLNMKGLEISLSIHFCESGTRESRQSN